MIGNSKPVKGSQVVNRRSICGKSPTGGHWWQISTPDGVVSVGVCRYCGQQKHFANTMDALVMKSSFRTEDK